jgi:hypothetical protein
MVCTGVIGSCLVDAGFFSVHLKHTEELAVLMEYNIFHSESTRSVGNPRAPMQLVSSPSTVASGSPLDSIVQYGAALQALRRRVQAEQERAERDHAATGGSAHVARAAGPTTVPALDVASLLAQRRGGHPDGTHTSGSGARSSSSQIAAAEPAMHHTIRNPTGSSPGTGFTAAPAAAATAGSSPFAAARDRLKSYIAHEEEAVLFVGDGRSASTLDYSTADSARHGERSSSSCSRRRRG